MGYTRITVTMVVRDDQAEDVRKELDDSLDIIEIDHTIYFDEMKSESVPRPENADQFEMGSENYQDEMSDSLLMMG